MLRLSRCAGLVGHSSGVTGNWRAVVRASLYGVRPRVILLELFGALSSC